MTRIVGNRDRNEFEPDPVLAHRRGLALDAMLAGARPPRPRGVVRGTHALLNRLDDQQSLAAARQLNGPA